MISGRPSNRVRMGNASRSASGARSSNCCNSIDRAGSIRMGHRLRICAFSISRSSSPIWRQAYRRLCSVSGWTAISIDGPQRLPASSGGVSAFKFRDPDGHPLELLAFPDGAWPAHWQARSNGDLALGIDHSAISVSDSARSIAFYEALGLRVAGAFAEHRVRAGAPRRGQSPARRSHGADAATRDPSCRIAVLPVGGDSRKHQPSFQRRRRDPSDLRGRRGRLRKHGKSASLDRSGRPSSCDRRVRQKQRILSTPKLLANAGAPPASAKPE